MIKEAASDARKDTAAAISSGVPSLLSGVSSASVSLIPGGSSSSISVSITPGATQLTRMPVGASSLASDRENPMSAAFVAEYALSQEAPRSPHIDETVIMHPVCSRSI